jgi:hypothetical protein
MDTSSKDGPTKVSEKCELEYNMTCSVAADGTDVVCSDDAEITFKSVDNVLFRIHKDNLQACTEGFSPPEGSTFSEVVGLSEPASILTLLFQFIYPVPVPDLESTEASVLSALAEAAEKYQVYPAMGICRIYMLFVCLLSMFLWFGNSVAENLFLKRLCPFSRMPQSMTITTF